MEVYDKMDNAEFEQKMQEYREKIKNGEIDKPVGLTPIQNAESCYSCSHYLVCNYFKILHGQFPYKDDHSVRIRLVGIAKCNAEACAHYQKGEE